MPTIDASDLAMDYLKSLAEPFVDTPKSVLDRIVDEHKRFSQRLENRSDEHIDQYRGEVYKGGRIPPLEHSKPVAAKIKDQPVYNPKWSSILEEMIRTAVRLGNDPDEVRKALKGQTHHGERHDTGFRYIKEAGFSFQGLDSNRSCEAALGISATFNIPLMIDIIWRDNPKAHRPGAPARIVGP